MTYENNWESLNSRPVPEWFEDAKFGIFIHWGIYSVPAISEKGTFSEWYWNSLDRKQQVTYDFHVKNYGEDFKYPDFAKLFKAELFDAKKWADLFQKSGARYMNLVSKHHDGYCMFDSSYAPDWNSCDVGPNRDFCRELMEALKDTDVKFGVYHSIYEWYHPLYLENPEKYALEHLIPMMKELIEKYKPYTLFTDGEWDHESSVWHSEDFLAWLYNESSVKDYIVPNDRWGRETRGRKGGNFTSEYGEIGVGMDMDSVFDDRVMEECRGIGGSFGFNRLEQSEDYLSTKELLKLFLDLIGRGKNLLLNIGPAGDGTIPVVMEERLLDIGRWLKVNGEGIYCSRKYKISNQDGIYYSKRGEFVYAFTEKFPFGNIILEDIDYKDGLKVTLLGGEQKIQTENVNGKLKLVFEPISPDCVESNHYYTLKIEGLL